MSQPINVLYVDDEPSNVFLFKVNFRNKFNVLTAHSGQQGLEVLKSNPGTDVVITDMKMPGMDGLEFISLAKKEFPDVSYFLLTGFDESEDIVQAVDTGLIIKFFRKPIIIKDIEDSIRNTATQPDK